MKRILSFLALLAVLVPCAAGLAADRAGRKAGAAPPALRMEDLEVRGLKERPEVLYAPSLKGAAHPSPVRYDLFTVDMNRAVSPLDTAPQAPSSGGDTKTRSVP